MIREVLKYPHPALKKTAAAISAITPELRALAADMLETMYANEGIGLAAPQIGESIRMIVMDVSRQEDPADVRVYVNPKLELTGEEVELEEGCLSVREYRQTVRRASSVRLTALDLDGNPVETVAEGLPAVCLQHECDHLDGKLFIDRISRLKRSLYNAKVKKWQQEENQHA